MSSEQKEMSLISSSGGNDDVRGILSKFVPGKVDQKLLFALASKERWESISKYLTYLKIDSNLHCVIEAALISLGDDRERLLKLAEADAATTPYTVYVTNASGTTQTVSLFQQKPAAFENGLSTVWRSQAIGSTVPAHFTWNVTWSLGWSFSVAPIGDGVGIGQKSPLVDVSPVGGGTNAVSIGYESGAFQAPVGKNNPSVSSGSIGISTTNQFTAAEAKAKNFNLLVCMYGNPIAVIAGNPGMNYNVATHPTYYIGITQYKLGDAVDITGIGNLTPVTFPVGSTTVAFTLNANLQFIPSTPPS